MPLPSICDDETPEILYSLYRNRRNPQPVDGAIAAGDVIVYVFTSVPSDTTRVDWFLNDTAMNFPPIFEEQDCVFDALGTAPDGRAAVGIDLGNSDAGIYTVTAKIHRALNPDMVVSATFIVLSF